MPAETCLSKGPGWLNIWYVSNKELQCPRMLILCMRGDGIPDSRNCCALSIWDFSVLNCNSFLNLSLVVQGAASNVCSVLRSSQCLFLKQAYLATTDVVEPFTL